MLHAYEPLACTCPTRQCTTDFCLKWDGMTPRAVLCALSTELQFTLRGGCVCGLGWGPTRHANQSASFSPLSSVNSRTSSGWSACYRPFTLPFIRQLRLEQPPTCSEPSAFSPYEVALPAILPCSQHAVHCCLCFVHTRTYVAVQQAGGHQFITLRSQLD